MIDQERTQSRRFRYVRYRALIGLCITGSAHTMAVTTRIDVDDNTAVREPS